MKTVVIYGGSSAPLSPYAALGLPDPHFFVCYEVGTAPGQVHPNKVRHLKDSGRHPYWFGVEMAKEGLMSWVHVLRMCDADRVLEEE